MSAPADARVLPWARVGSESAGEAHAPAEQLQSAERGAPAVELQLGQRIEVRWQLSDEESGETTLKWWGAEVVQQGSAAAEGQPWRIRYDAESGYDAEEADVHFLSPGQLLSGEDVLLWRVEGRECAEEGAEQVVGLQELTAEQADMERELGQSVEQAALQHMAGMAPEQQARIMGGFRTFADHFTSRLRELVQARESDADYVITESDVHQMLQGLKQ